MGELKDLFEQLDTDKTGSVTFDEFMVALRVSFYACSSLLRPYFLKV